MPLELFVNGTLMRGLALHANLEGAEFLGEAHTAPVYRVYSIDDVHPGMFQVESGGISVPVRSTGCQMTSGHEYKPVSDQISTRVP